MGTPCWRSNVDRRQLLLGEHVERHRQQHGDRAGRGERRSTSARSCIRGGRTDSARWRAATGCRRCCRAARRAGAPASRARAPREQAVALRRAERDVLAERVDDVDERPCHRWLVARRDAAASPCRSGRCTRRRGPRIPAAPRARRATSSTTVTGKLSLECARRQQHARVRSRTSRPYPDLISTVVTPSCSSERRRGALAARVRRRPRRASRARC